MQSQEHKDWIQIHCQWSPNLAGIEILAVGEINGITGKASKTITSRQLTGEDPL